MPGRISDLDQRAANEEYQYPLLVPIFLSALSVNNASVARAPSSPIFDGHFFYVATEAKKYVKLGIDDSSTRSIITPEVESKSRGK